MALSARVALCLSLGLAPFPIAAQEHRGHAGHFGDGHARHHAEFYSKLIRKDTKTSCCNMTDCRPTQSRAKGAHYEVMVDGQWTPVPPDAIQNVRAPDGGAHVCAPQQVGRNKGVLYCVVLPAES